MFEGKEVDGKIGKAGSYFVDVHENADIEFGLSIKVNLLDEMKNLAVKKNITWLLRTADFLEGMIRK